MYKNVSQSSPSFCRCVSVLFSKHARKRFDRIQIFLSLLSTSWLNVQSQLRTSNELVSAVIHSHMLIAPSEYSLLHCENNRGINVPNEKAVPKALDVLLKGTRVSNEHAFWTLSWTCVLGWMWTLHWSKAERGIVDCPGGKVSSSGTVACPPAAWNPARHYKTSIRNWIEYFDYSVQYCTYNTRIWL